MLKLFSLKTWGSLALSLSFLGGALALTPVTSAFARRSPAYIPARHADDTSGGGSYADKYVDKEDITVYAASTLPYWLYSPDNLRADGKWTVKGR